MQGVAPRTTPQSPMTSSSAMCLCTTGVPLLLSLACLQKRGDAAVKAILSPDMLQFPPVPALAAAGANFASALPVSGACAHACAHACAPLPLSVPALLCLKGVVEPAKPSIQDLALPQQLILSLLIASTQNTQRPLLFYGRHLVPIRNPGKGPIRIDDQRAKVVDLNTSAIHSHRSAGWRWSLDERQPVRRVKEVVQMAVVTWYEPMSTEGRHSGGKATGVQLLGNPLYNAVMGRNSAYMRATARLSVSSHRQRSHTVVTSGSGPLNQRCQENDGNTGAPSSHECGVLCGGAADSCDQ